MDPIHHFAFIKDCLKDFDYPCIHSFNDDQIAEVLSASNRRFLVVWIFKKLAEEYIPHVDNMKNDELVDLIYESGLCSRSKAKDFMKGETEQLSWVEQLAIIYKMLKYLKELKNKPTNNSTTTVSVDDIMKLQQRDTNLFPEYGAKKVLSPKSRQEKIEQYEKEIADLKNRLNSVRTNNSNTPTLNNNVAKLVSLGSLCETKITEFTTLASNLIQQINAVAGDTVEIKPDLKKCMKHCCQDITAIDKLVTNIATIKTLLGCSESNALDEPLSGDVKMLLQELSGLVTDVYKDGHTQI